MLDFGDGDGVGFEVFWRVKREVRASSSTLRAARLTKSTSPTTVPLGSKGSCNALALVGST